MRTPPPVAYAAAALLALGLGLAGCADDDPQADPSPGASSSDSSPASPEPSESAPSSPTTGPTGGTAAGGTAEQPTALEASTALLPWRPVRGSVDDTVTRNQEWTLTVADGGGSWQLSGPGDSAGGSTRGWRVSDALLDEDWAVVVEQDPEEQQPSRARIVDLESGRTRTLDGRSPVPTTNGGTWALGEDRLLHATLRDGAYCLAEVDLETGRAAVAWCAPKRHGFNAAHVTDAGISLLTFDDAQPSCRTVAAVEGGALAPFPGVPECKGWEGLLLADDADDAADTAVWSVVPRERSVEEGHVYARVGTGYFDLGPAVSGSLTACGDAAYFARDPQRRGEPATVLRWDPDDGLAVVYRSPRGQAFLEAPRCGGDALTVTARTSSGDEQVTAALD